MLSRIMKAAVAGAFTLMLCGAGFAQSGAWPWYDDDHYSAQYHERQRFYDEGVRDGREDREHHRDFRIRDRYGEDRADRDAYIAGYRAGFASAGYAWRSDERDYYHDLRARAREFGYQDGLRDGEHDRYTGHSYRPTHDDNYKHADRGYDPSYGDKHQYRDEYRVAYSEGYQRGYSR